MTARRVLTAGALLAVGALLLSPVTAATAGELPVQRAIDRPGAPVPVEPALGREMSWSIETWDVR